MIVLVVSSNDTLAFQSLQDPVQKWPSLFSVALVAPFQLLSRSLFFSASFSASSSQLGTASSVMCYKPATVDESFYVPSESAGSVSLPLGFFLNFSGKQVFSLLVTFSPLATHCLIWSLN